LTFRPKNGILRITRCEKSKEKHSENDLFKI